MKHKTIQTHQNDEVKKERTMKYVKVDNRTTILVPSEKPDEEARNEYLLKIRDNRRLDNQSGDQRWKY